MNQLKWIAQTFENLLNVDIKIYLLIPDDWSFWSKNLEKSEHCVNSGNKVPGTRDVFWTPSNA